MTDHHTSNLLPYYAALETASQEMLDAARQGDWDGVCRLEGACAIVIAKIRQVTSARPLRDGEQNERMRILRAILANDAAIRRICHPMPAVLDPMSFRVGEVSVALH